MLDMDGAGDLLECRDLAQLPSLIGRVAARFDRRAQLPCRFTSIRERYRISTAKPKVAASAV